MTSPYVPLLFSIMSFEQMSLFWILLHHRQHKHHSYNNFYFSMFFYTFPNIFFICFASIKFFSTSSYSYFLCHGSNMFCIMIRWETFYGYWFRWYFYELIAEYLWLFNNLHTPTHTCTYFQYVYSLLSFPSYNEYVEAKRQSKKFFNHWLTAF